MTAPTVDTAAQVQAALTALGATATNVADTLFQAGIRGHRGSVTACPISRLLEDIPGVDRVHATPLSLIVYAGGDLTVVDTPPAVGRFMARFDIGLYDELVDGGEGGSSVAGGAA